MGARSKPVDDIAPNDCFSDAKLPVNVGKNRYRDVLPYNHNRVQLPGGGYINASHIISSVGEQRFIMCQGPLQSTCEDFWNMVCCNDVRVIVMLARLVEKGTPKVFPYWKDTRGGVATFGDINVTTTEVHSHTNWIERTFEVTHARQRNAASRTVRHLHFTGWPDHGAPRETGPFIEFMQAFRTLPAAARLCSAVHCSAGIGRAGTFTLLQHCLDACLLEGRVDMRAELVQLRHDRPAAVQTLEQYVFAHKVVAEWLALYGRGVGLGLAQREYDYLRTLTAGSQSGAFEPGLPGRRLQRLFQAQLQESDAHQVVCVAVFNDTVVLSAATSGSGSSTALVHHMLLCRPCPRHTVGVEHMRGDATKVRLALADGKVVFVAMRNEEDTRELVRLLQDKALSTSTVALTGASLLASKHTPLAVLDLLQLPDAYSQEGRTMLAEEFMSVPRHFTPRMDRRALRPARFDSQQSESAWKAPSFAGEEQSTGWITLASAAAGHDSPYGNGSEQHGGMAASASLEQHRQPVLSDGYSTLPGQPLSDDMQLRQGMNPAWQSRLESEDLGYIVVGDEPTEEAMQPAAAGHVADMDTLAMDVLRVQQRRQSMNACGAQRPMVADTNIDDATQNWAVPKEQGGITAAGRFPPSEPFAQQETLPPSDSVLNLLTELRILGEEPGPEQGVFAPTKDTAAERETLSKRQQGVSPSDSVLNLLTELRRLGQEDGANTTEESIESMLLQLHAINLEDARMQRKNTRSSRTQYLPEVPKAEGIRIDENGRRVSIGGLQLAGAAASRLIQRQHRKRSASSASSEPFHDQASQPLVEPGAPVPAAVRKPTDVVAACTYLGNCQCPNCAGL